MTEQKALSQTFGPEQIAALWPCNVHCLCLNNFKEEFYQLMYKGHLIVCFCFSGKHMTNDADKAVKKEEVPEEIVKGC